MSSVNAVIASPVIVPTTPPQPANVDPLASPSPQASTPASSQDNSSSQNQASQSVAQQSDNNPPSPPQPNSIYTAVASVNAPTIRGTSVNVVT